MDTLGERLNIYHLAKGTLLKTRHCAIGMFVEIKIQNKHVIWNPKDEIPVTGNFIILSDLHEWKNVHGYQVLSPIGKAWLIWSDNAKFGQNPEEYVEIIN